VDVKVLHKPLLVTSSRASHKT